MLWRGGVAGMDKLRKAFISLLFQVEGFLNLDTNWPCEMAKSGVEAPKVGCILVSSSRRFSCRSPPKLRHILAS